TNGAEEWIERSVGIVAGERERTRPAGRGATDGDQLTVRLEDERRYFRITGEAGDDAALAAEEGIECPVGIVAREGEPRGHTVRCATGDDDLSVGLEDERQRLGVSREAGDDTAAGAEERIERPVGVVACEHEIAPRPVRRAPRRDDLAV